MFSGCSERGLKDSFSCFSEMENNDYGSIIDCSKRRRGFCGDECEHVDKRMTDWLVTICGNSDWYSDRVVILAVLKAPRFGGFIPAGSGCGPAVKRLWSSGPPVGGNLILAEIK
jgi:hypothetical protein